MIDKDENKADELPEVGRRDRPRRHSSTARVEAVLRFDMHERLPEKWHLPSARLRASILQGCHATRSPAASSPARRSSRACSLASCSRSAASRCLSAASPPEARPTVPPAIRFPRSACGLRRRPQAGACRECSREDGRCSSASSLSSDPSAAGRGRAPVATPPGAWISSWLSTRFDSHVLEGNQTMSDEILQALAPENSPEPRQLLHTEDRWLGGARASDLVSRRAGGRNQASSPLLTKGSSLADR